MFATPNTAEARRPEGGRRSLAHSFSSTSQRRDSGGDAEAPVPDQGDEGEMLSILRSIQQQVSAIQAQQAQSTPSTPARMSAESPSAASVSSASQSPAERKLPKSLTSSVRQAVKHLRERLEDPLEWNSSLRYNGEHNAAVTAEIVKIVANESYSVALVRRAARTYFLTLQRHYKRVNTGKLQESQLKQRRTQRKHNKLRYRRSACAASTSLSQTEKEKLLKILTLDFMSSEETGSESGSENEGATSIRRKIFLSRPLTWRSGEANNYFESLDRKVARRRITRAKEMCRLRRVGPPSSRSPPGDEAQSWALKD